MSRNAYKSQLIEDMKSLEEDSRELRKQLKTLKKRKRKLKRLDESDITLMEFCEEGLAVNDKELAELKANLFQINDKEEESKSLVETY